jgi:hypothetical protein
MEGALAHETLWIPTSCGLCESVYFCLSRLEENYRLALFVVTFSSLVRLKGPFYLFGCRTFCLTQHFGNLTDQQLFRSF